MRKILAIAAVFLLASSIPARAQSPSPCLDVTGGQVCMSFVPADGETPADTLVASDTPTTAPTNTSTVAPTSTTAPTYTPYPTSTPFSMAWQSNIDFLRMGGIGQDCPNTSTTWNWLTGLTASTYPLYADRMHGVAISLAVARFVWSPNSNATPSGVRLISFDNGPTNIVEIVKDEQANQTGGVRNDGYDITAALQSILSAGVYKNLGVQYHGDGTHLCHTYSAWIEVVWSKP